MELEFEKRQLKCLAPVLSEVRDLELTQEIRLGEDMPDIQKVYACWAQGVLRGKEWTGSEVTASGGVTVWAAYQAEGEDRARLAQCWIPFQMKWPVGDSAQAAVALRVRQADARSASARKILVRVCLSGLARVYAPKSFEIPAPENVPKGVELLRQSYPLVLLKEAGEKTFPLEEPLDLSAGTVTGPALLRPEITDCRIQGNKLAIRGNVNLEVFLEGGTQSKTYPIPFAQFAELDGTYGDRAAALAELTTAGAEVEGGEDPTAKLSLTLQYRITDRENVELTQDGYCLDKVFTNRYEQLPIPVILDQQTLNLKSQHTLDGSGECRVWEDFPRKVPGSDGAWQQRYTGQSWGGQAERWEENFTWNTAGNGDALPEALRVAVKPVGEESLAETEERIVMTAWSDAGLSVLSAMELGENREETGQKPSLILRRPGENTLWEIARDCGSTVERIRQANGLEGEPEPNRMLLIPVV